MAEGKSVAKMQFLSVVRNAFLRSLEQPYFYNIARLSSSMFLKKGCGDLEYQYFNSQCIEDL
ncbi:hypothetical protein AR438_11045 [Chryseobacterium aquaticum]|uniref:Uncharacterized protein n=1 Tax=Chryseobacterium aquaticum TaxID=452084 RepID=A0A0Q3HUC2_9FLAO|nr:hypothetical protein AR438_11045 [Chryseobacterium aquaticum]